MNLLFKVKNLGNSIASTRLSNKKEVIPNNF